MDTTNINELKEDLIKELDSVERTFGVAGLILTILLFISVWALRQPMEKEPIEKEEYVPTWNVNDKPFK